ncbi:hypothetical protein BCR33DRAFT_782408 [Rhizoclosmatium globosum]|uniref:HSF-type DNA-binding domain-containing protein n=1 Tax=Rhizoclosmatium globosum TaxID=329046 RepID=A0A1Y2CPG3_9FUNG|nr:hypothetical protein BCR33DRAFT_782408 [Rhizoclosmatium globosum]|eukprot:ORY48724.1 hypothetical protein BCR33DRAFT_782408 [Rhizoclosmatium globosum]
MLQSRASSHSISSPETTNLRANLFIRKLYKVVSDPDNHNIIRWTPDGLSFIIVDIASFANIVLPKLATHKNFASFIRQLNKYQFRKIKATERQNLSETPHPEFRHPYFIHGSMHTLHLVCRVKKGRQTRKDIATVVVDSDSETVASSEKPPVTAPDWTRTQQLDQAEICSNSTLSYSPPVSPWIPFFPSNHPWSFNAINKISDTQIRMDRIQLDVESMWKDVSSTYNDIRTLNRTLLVDRPRVRTIVDNVFRSLDEEEYEFECMDAVERQFWEDVCPFRTDVGTPMSSSDEETNSTMFSSSSSNCIHESEALKPRNHEFHPYAAFSINPHPPSNPLINPTSPPLPPNPTSHKPHPQTQTIHPLLTHLEHRHLHTTHETQKIHATLETTTHETHILHRNIVDRMNSMRDVIDGIVHALEGEEAEVWGMDPKELEFWRDVCPGDEFEASGEVGVAGLGLHGAKWKE